MMRPVLSIVVANYNYGRFLEEAIQSVIAQNLGSKVEMIICDAASTDNSVKIIRKYAGGLPPNTDYTAWHHSISHQPAVAPQLVTWWCSEKDGGQSNAFNKGFSHARGKFLTWLNADDWFSPGALHKVLKYIEENPDEEWFAGGGCRVDADGKIMKLNRTRKFQKIRANVGEVQTCGPSSFFAKTLYDRVGGYVDEDLHYAMDIELWERFYHIGKAVYKVIPGYLWMFRVHEASKTAAEDAGVHVAHDSTNAAWIRMMEENRRIKEKYAIYKLTWWRRLLSISPVENILSIIDTLRFRGHSWKDLFPLKS